MPNPFLPALRAGSSLAVGIRHCISMNIGKLRLRVTILAPNPARDSLGNLQAPTTFATVWAELIPAGSTYKQFQEQVSTEATWKLTIRYLAGLNTSMRVSYGGRLFEIVVIQDPTGKKRQLDLTIIERNSGRS